jgi:hypothetical protein
VAAIGGVFEAVPRRESSVDTSTTATTAPATAGIQTVADGARRGHG